MGSMSRIETEVLTQALYHYLPFFKCAGFFIYLLHIKYSLSVAGGHIFATTPAPAYVVDNICPVNEKVSIQVKELLNFLEVKYLVF